MGATSLQQGQIQLQRLARVGLLAALSLAVVPATSWTQALGKPLEPTAAQSRPAAQQALRATYDAYILGPGDALEVELLNIPELSGRFSIGPDGTLYLPRLRALVVEGLTVEELRYFLTEQFKAYVKSPQLYVRPVGFRAVRVYVGGEITRPGYYLLSGPQKLADELSIREGVSPLDTRRQTTSLQDFAASQVRPYGPPRGRALLEPAENERERSSTVSCFSLISLA